MDSAVVVSLAVSGSFDCAADAASLRMTVPYVADAARYDL